MRSGSATAARSAGAAARTSGSSACSASASATWPSAGTSPAWARRPGEEAEMCMSTDPVADLLARVRNALAARHEKTDVPSSRFKVELARILKDEGYIKNYKV